MERFYYEAADDDNVWWIYDRLESEEPVGCMYNLNMTWIVVGLLNAQCRKPAEGEEL